MTVSTKKSEWAPSATASRPNTAPELAIHFPDDSGWLTPHELAALNVRRLLCRHNHGGNDPHAKREFRHE